MFSFIALMVVCSQPVLAQQGPAKNLDGFGPYYLETDMKIQENKLDESVFTGIGQKEEFVGKWEISSMGIKNYIGGRTDDKFLDLKNAADFQPDGVVVFWEQIKGKQLNVVERKYEVKDGLLLLKDNESQVELEFGFFENANKLALRTKNITMVLTKIKGGTHQNPN